MKGMADTCGSLHFVTVEFLFCSVVFVWSQDTVCAKYPFESGTGLFN